MHRPRLPYEERESTSTKWVVAFVLLSILAHIVTFFGFYLCAKNLPEPKLTTAPQTPEVSSMTYVEPPVPPAPKPKQKPKDKVFMPTVADPDAKPQNTIIESDNTTRLKSESKQARDPNSVVPDIVAKDHHTMDMTDSPLVQSKETPPAAPSPPTPKQEDKPQKPTPPEPPKPTDSKAQQPPPPDQPKATEAPKANPAPPNPQKPPPQIVKQQPPQLDDNGLPVLPPLQVPTMAPQTPSNPDQQSRKAAAARPPPSFQLDKSNAAGATGLNGPNSVSANASPLGKYKAKLYRAVGSRWYAKVGAQSDVMPVGVVRVQYTVYSDGSVTTKVLDGGNGTMQILTSISVNSIREAAPFDQFSPELIKQVGTSFTDDFSFSVY